MAAAMIIILFGFRRENFAIARIDGYSSRAPVMFYIDLPDEVALFIIEFGFHYLAGLHCKCSRFRLLLANLGISGKPGLRFDTAWQLDA